jgi:hypothetical protein
VGADETREEGLTLQVAVHPASQPSDRLDPAVGVDRDLDTGLEGVAGPGLVGFDDLRSFQGAGVDAHGRLHQRRI